MRPTQALLALPLLLAPACFISRDTVNVPLVQKTITELTPGKTTAKEVTALLGAPHEVVQLGKRTAYRYDYTTTKRAGFSILIVSFLNQDTRQDRAWLFFDDADVLTHVGSSLEAEGAAYAMPWMDVERD
ncbi:MAG: outer membrane protein assembly factor BamE [Planctomycetes bacterium]|nr:outer membrane protein assembly factor BamE [Planctomycetota bacterium]